MKTLMRILVFVLVVSVLAIGVIGCKPAEEGKKAAPAGETGGYGQEAAPAAGGGETGGYGQEAAPATGGYGESGGGESGGYGSPGYGQ